MSDKESFKLNFSFQLETAGLNKGWGDDSLGKLNNVVRMFSQGSGSSSGGKKPKIKVTRRRRTDGEGSQPRKRAQSPSRKRERQPSSPYATSGSGGGGNPPTYRPGTSSGIPMGGGSRLLIIGLFVLLLICLVPIMIFFGGSNDSSDLLVDQPTQPQNFIQATEPAVLASPEALEVFTPLQSSSEGKTWLVMLYQDADDKVLEKDIYVDLNEAERVGSNGRVQIVAQIDRYRGGYSGDGNWSSTKRYYLTPDEDLGRLQSQQVADLGEVNMSQGKSLVDFVTWAVGNFPADNYVLILSDHGMGWPGGWSDDNPDAPGDRSIPFSAQVGDRLYLMELDQALGEIREKTSIAGFELIGLDACLMGDLEVFTALAPHAHYVVASQENEPSLGWAYTSFLSSLEKDPDMSGAKLAQMVVDSYIEGDQRIVDDQARAELLRQGSPLGGLFGSLGGISADQLASQMSKSITLAAIDMTRVPDLIERLNALAYALQNDDQSSVASARNYAQNFTSLFGEKVPPSYLDLSSFSQLLVKESRNPQVKQAAQEVFAAVNEAVIAEKHGPEKPGATGISIYFPNSQLYRSPVSGPESYTAIAQRFARVSLWDDFLAYHYTGRTFEPDAANLAVPEVASAMRAPGSGQISISPINLSANTAAPDQPVILSADISGENIGYIYLTVGYYDRDANSIYLLDRDFLESDQTYEVNGVYYPIWPEDGAFTMEFEWQPVVFAINDGVDSFVALFTPQTYGSSYEQAVYTVEGIYTFADDGTTLSARLYFRDGWLRQVFTFSGEGGSGEAHEIIPQPGDRFTILEEWLDLDAQGNVQQVSTQEGGTLTFGDQMFRWETLDAPVGDYLVGFAVEDLDGKSVEQFANVNVK
jgi:hypothetical protein